MDCDASQMAMCVRRNHCINHPAQSVCAYRPSTTRRYCFATDTDGQLLNSCLLDHVITEFVTKSNPSCTSACIMEPACRSFNIKHSNQGEKICQLNNATRCDDPDQFHDVDFACNYAQECVD